MYNSSFGTGDGTKEKDFILGTTSADGILSNDHLFFLSRDEASNSTYFSSDSNRIACLNGNAVWWWLRSPGDTTEDAAYVLSRGGVSHDGLNVYTYYGAVRPAFNLNLSSVLFTSAAKGGKSSTAAGGGEAGIFENVDLDTLEGNDGYKLTMLDESRKNFSVTEKSVTGTKGATITLNYDKAQTGTTEYISAMIVKDGEVLYYGQGEKTDTLPNDDDPETEKGKVKFTLPNEIENGEYKLYVFNEQINGDKKTDFSSAFSDVTLNIKGTPTASNFTFAPPTSLTYDGKEKIAMFSLVGIGKGMGSVSYKYYDENEKKLENAPINAGTYTVKIDVAEGTNYNAAYDLTADNWKFTILPKTVEAMISDIADQTYTESEIKPTITAYDGITVIPRSEYTVGYANNTNAGTATVRLTDNTGGNYIVSGSTTFEILPKSIDDATVGTFAAMTYNGTEQTPSAEVSIDGLIATGTWSKVTNIGDKTTFTADGNFTGEISNKSTGMKKLPVIIEWKNTEGLVFDNTKKTITAEVSNKKGDDVVNLTIDGDLTGTSKGTYTATVTAVNNENYTIENGQNLEKKWVISQANDNLITNLAINDWTYGDTENTPTATAKYGTPSFTYSTEENGSYVVTVPTNAGTYWVKATVVGTEDYAEISSKPVSFTIAQATPTENSDKKTTARVLKGRTLADATVTNGEILGINGIVLDGTYAWVDDTKTISADATEQMTFTPTDANYAPITIEAEVNAYVSGGGGSYVSRYTVKFDTNGGNTITNQTVTKNGKVTEPTAPTKVGYIFDGWYADGKFTTEYDFDTKVTKNITLYAKWVEDEVQEPSDDKKDDEPQTDDWKNPFTDVKETDWFFVNVKYANQNGLMSGITNTTFAPNESLTRAMLVTVLYRAEGEPVVNYAMPFTDIIDTAYYAEAVRWAASENIVNGVTETEFAPDMNITREQIAAIIYRYAKYKGYDVSVGEDTNILSYTDFDEISEYAIEAMQYAVGMGLMKGKTESTLNPKDNATRAEISAILNRFIEGNN